MSACLMIVLDDHGFIPGYCGQPLQGRGPCATCGDSERTYCEVCFDSIHDAARVSDHHSYVPSEYVCANGHISKSAPGSEATARVSEPGAHVEQG